jgi:hypothetical protein
MWMGLVTPHPSVGRRARRIWCRIDVDGAGFARAELRHQHNRPTDLVHVEQEKEKLKKKRKREITMTITLDWLNRHRTDRNGFTMAQVQALGLTWPPRKGWLRQQVGREISEIAAVAFEIGRTVTATSHLYPEERATYQAFWTAFKIIPPPLK